MRTPELRKCPFCKQESLFWNSYSNIYECLNLKCKRRITADEFSSIEKGLPKRYLYWRNRRFRNRTTSYKEHFSPRDALLFLLALIIVGAAIIVPLVFFSSSHEGQVISGQTSTSTPVVTTTFGSQPTQTSQSTPTPSPKTTPALIINLSELERLTFSLVNSERSARGLSPLQWSDSIASVARNHSVDMANHDYFAHENLQGRDMGDRLQNAGIGWHMCAENICCVPAVKTYHYINGRLVSKDSYTMEQLAEEAVSSWMESSGHRANILNAGYTYSGLGVGRGIQDGEDSFLFTQDFVSP